MSVASIRIRDWARKGRAVDLAVGDVICFQGTPKQSKGASRVHIGKIEDICEYGFSAPHVIHFKPSVYLSPTTSERGVGVFSDHKGPYCSNRIANIAKGLDDIAVLLAEDPDFLTYVPIIQSGGIFNQNPSTRKSYFYPKIVPQLP